MPMTIDWTTIIVASITGLLTGGLGVAIVNGLFGRKQADADAELTEQEATAKIIEAAKTMCEAMQVRIDVLHERVGYVESQLKGRNQMIEEITAENRALKAKVDELEKERDQQIALNRSQGQKIHHLTKQLEEAYKRIRQLEEKLGGNG